MMSEKQQAERPVLKAIAAIMAEVGSVEKRGENKFHNYSYATAADVAHALQKRMADAGLIIVPSQRRMELLAEGSALAIEFEFLVEHVSGDKLDERPVFTGMASAKNSKGGFDDKAANKCLTAATKYFALNLFRIPTGEYHDADADADKPAASGRRSSYSIKQKAAKGEGDEWGEFMTTLEAANTVAEVDALQKLMEQATFPNWPAAYVESAKEELDKRREALIDAPTMQSKAEYVQECIEIIDGATDAAALKQWWESGANARKRFSFTQSDVDDLRARIAGKLQELTVLNKPTVVAADALADAMEPQQ